MATPLRASRHASRTPARQRADYLWKAAEAISHLPESAGFLSMRMRHLCELTGIEPPAEAIRQSCARCESPVHVSISIPESSAQGLKQSQKRRDNFQPVEQVDPPGSYACHTCGYNSQKQKDSRMSEQTRVVPEKLISPIAQTNAADTPYMNQPSVATTPPHAKSPETLPMSRTELVDVCTPPSVIATVACSIIVINSSTPIGKETDLGAGLPGGAQSDPVGTPAEKTEQVMPTPGLPGHIVNASPEDSLTKVPITGVDREGHGAAAKTAPVIGVAENSHSTPVPAPNQAETDASTPIRVPLSTPLLAASSLPPGYTATTPSVDTNGTGVTPSRRAGMMTRAQEAKLRKERELMGGTEDDEEVQSAAGALPDTRAPRKPRQNGTLIATPSRTPSATPGGGRGRGRKVAAPTLAEAEAEIEAGAGAGAGVLLETPKAGELNKPIFIDLGESDGAGGGLESIVEATEATASRQTVPEQGGSQNGDAVMHPTDQTPATPHQPAPLAGVVQEAQGEAPAAATPEVPQPLLSPSPVEIVVLDQSTPAQTPASQEPVGAETASHSDGPKERELDAPVPSIEQVEQVERVEQVVTNPGVEPQKLVEIHVEGSGGDELMLVCKEGKEVVEQSGEGKVEGGEDMEGMEGMENTEEKTEVVEVVEGKGEAVSSVVACLQMSGVGGEEEMVGEGSVAGIAVDGGGSGVQSVQEGVKGEEQAQVEEELRRALEVAVGEREEAGRKLAKEVEAKRAVEEELKRMQEKVAQLEREAQIREKKVEVAPPVVEKQPSLKAATITVPESKAKRKRKKSKKGGTQKQAVVVEVARPGSEGGEVVSKDGDALWVELKEEAARRDEAMRVAENMSVVPMQRSFIQARHVEEEEEDEEDDEEEEEFGHKHKIRVQYIWVKYGRHWRIDRTRVLEGCQH